VSVDSQGTLTRLYSPGTVAQADDPKVPDGWVNFYRSDDISATAYFYLDAPSSRLPPLQGVAERVSGGK